MNSVSIFLYLADVVTSFSNLLSGFLFTSLALIGMGAIPACIGKFDDIMGDGSFFDKVWLPLSKRMAVPLIISAVLVVAIPSKSTMYAIAASQIGETVVTSPEAREMIDDTKTILRDYLKSLKKDVAK